MRDVQQIQVLALGESGPHYINDEVVVEEPLEIRVNNVTLGITMRTPGDDFDLAAGLLHTEGLIQTVDEIGTLAYCLNEDTPELKNVVSVTLADSNRRIDASRLTWSNSSCGICGKSGIDRIRLKAGPI
jgi:FdhD protein